MCQFVFGYNSGVSWPIFYTFCTTGNRNGYSALQYRGGNKIYHFIIGGAAEAYPHVK